MFKILLPLPVQRAASEEWAEMLPMADADSRASDSSSNSCRTSISADAAAVFAPARRGGGEWAADKGYGEFIPVTIEDGRVRRKSALSEPLAPATGSTLFSSPSEPPVRRRRSSVPNPVHAPRTARPGKIVVAVATLKVEESLCEALKDICGNVIVARPERLQAGASAWLAAGSASGLPRRAPSAASSDASPLGCAPVAGVSSLGRVPSSALLAAVHEQQQDSGRSTRSAAATSGATPPESAVSEIETFRLGALHLATWGAIPAAAAAGFPAFGGSAQRQRVLPVIMECSHLLRLCAGNAREAASLLLDPRLFFITVGFVSERKELLAAIREPSAISKVAFVSLPFKFSVLQRTVHMLFDPALVVALPRGATVALNQNDREMANLHPLRILVADGAGKQRGPLFSVPLTLQPSLFRLLFPDRSLALAAHPRARGIFFLSDNATNQKVAKAVLGHFGYVPEVVDNGQEAVERVLQKAFDLILMARARRESLVSVAVHATDAPTEALHREAESAWQHADTSAHLGVLRAGHRNASA